MMKIRTIDSSRPPDLELVAEIEGLLASGQALVLPTETVYGLGADPSVPGALENLFRIKTRPEDKKIAVLASDLDAVERHAGLTLDGAARRLAEAFWPGALTLVLPTADGGDLGFRVPGHVFTRELLARLGRVLAVTSANFSGEPPAKDAEEAARTLGSYVGLVLDGGPSREGIPSTVVSLCGPRPVILREGGLDRSTIERVAGPLG